MVNSPQSDLTYCSVGKSDNSTNDIVARLIRRLGQSRQLDPYGAQGLYMDCLGLLLVKRQTSYLRVKCSDMVCEQRSDGTRCYMSEGSQVQPMFPVQIKIQIAVDLVKVHGVEQPVRLGVMDGEMASEVTLRNGALSAAPTLSDCSGIPFLSLSTSRLVRSRRDAAHYVLLDQKFRILVQGRPRRDEDEFAVAGH